MRKLFNLKFLNPIQIPAIWLKLWCGPGSSSAVDFLRALIVRAQAAEQRFREQVNLEFGEEINLIHVFNCENLLACLKLLQSRKTGMSSERLELKTCGLDNSEADSSTVVLKLAPLKVSAIFKGFYGILRTSFENSDIKFIKHISKISKELVFEVNWSSTSVRWVFYCN